jgi:hypothetical protein
VFEFINVPLMLGALVPDVIPETPLWGGGAGQLYVVPGGTISGPFSGVITKACPLQIDIVLFAMTGAGITVTVTVNEEPVQEPDAGVTV